MTAHSHIFYQTDVEEAFPRWGKNSKLVLVSLLLTGLLLAALLVAGYYLKTHRKNSKGVRLVSSLVDIVHWCQMSCLNFRTFHTIIAVCLF